MIEIRRAGDRAATAVPGITTRHGFSSGPHYDPANVSFGRLIAHDLHVVAPGAGFDTHRHRGVEIVSWVLSGTLLHNDDRAVPSGTVQHVSAGDGIEHSERNGGADELRFVQMSLLGEPGLPAYRIGTAVELPGARFQVLAGAAHLPGAPFVHVFVADGTATFDAVPLNAGDELRVTEQPVLLCATGAVLVWEMTGRAHP